MDFVSLLAYIVLFAVPAFLIYLIFVHDLFDTGKSNTVAICLGWGALGAFSIAYGANTLVIHTFNHTTAITITAPVIEEFLKALVLLYIISLPRFRYFVDGAVYGFATGIGFAMSENLLYMTGGDTHGVLLIALSRVLSASLMHATASSVVGIALGLSRRTGGTRKRFLPVTGLIFATGVHTVYNNLTLRLEGGLIVLIAAIAIGLGGGLLIGYAMDRGLKVEKRRFTDALGTGTGVSVPERIAVQQIGTETLETILDEMRLIFGRQKADLIRRLLLIEANIGILNTNLESPTSERLRQAWQVEVNELHKEIDTIRRKLGAYTMTLVRTLLPAEGRNHPVWADFTGKIASYAPTHVHSFDLFMVVSRITESISPEQLERTSTHLKKIAIFKNVDIADLDNLSRAVVMRHYSHGEMLFDRDDEGDAMYLIDRGYIDIFTVDIEGIQHMLRTFGPGDVVGELALLDSLPRSARARANGPLRVMMLHREHFIMFIQSRPGVIMAVLQFLADRVRYVTDALSGEILPQLTIVAEGTEPDSSGIAPEVTDTVTTSSVSGMGVFSRLNKALDRLESETFREKDRN